MVTGHLPHPATFLEAKAVLTTWQTQLAGDPKRVLGMDANEMFKGRRGSNILAESARSELPLDTLDSLAMKIPPQNLDRPSYFPYNQQMRPRRLDYVCTRHMLTSEGGHR